MEMRFVDSAKLVRRFLSTFLHYACAFLALAVVVIVFMQVIYRFVFQSPFAWAEELARYTFIWLSILGGVLAIDKKAHFNVDLLASHLTPKRRRYLDISLRVIVGLLLIVITSRSIRLIIIAGDQVTPTLNVPFSYIFILLPFGFAAMCFFLVFSGFFSSSKDELS